VSRADRGRQWREPVALGVVTLLGSAAVWGRLWATSPTTRGVCGCGDPSLFQWFLAWPAHAITTGHSLVFSRDLFHPDGVNLLANTSVLALGVVLAPATWLFGPVLTQNLALLLAVPTAVVAMDLLLRRATDVVPVRVACALLYGFSPYVVASLAVSHLMTAWIAVLPLIALGAVDAVADDRGRRIRGQVLLATALVVQFFLSTELLLLAAVVVVVLAVVLGVTALVTWRVPDVAWPAARRLAWPLGASVVLLAAPAAYALWGPRSLKGNIWGPGFNPDTGGSSWRDLLRPHAVGGGLTALSGYTGPPVVQIQLVGWGLVVVTAAITVWRWRDGVVRAAALTALGCLVLALSPLSVSWAPWQWIGRLPVLQDILQFRIVVFALIAALVVLARGAGVLARGGRAGAVAAAAALAVVIVPVAVPVAQSLPLRTVHVGVPTWWRTVRGPGVVLAYPYASPLLQAPLTWQAHGAFAVAQLGGGGPQGTVARAGQDAAATAVLDALSIGCPGLPRHRPVTVPGCPDDRAWPDRPTATPANARLVRAMVVRDGVTEVVVPVTLRGRPIVTGAPSPWAAAFFTQVLGLAPVVEGRAWVFGPTAVLPPPHLVTRAAARRCAALAASVGPGTLAPCVLGGRP